MEGGQLTPLMRRVWAAKQLHPLTYLRIVSTRLSVASVRQRVLVKVASKGCVKSELNAEGCSFCCQEMRGTEFEERTSPPEQEHHSSCWVRLGEGLVRR
jgi:hypothetical protein